MADYDEMGNYTGYDNYNTGYDSGYDYTAQPVAPQPISYDPFGNPVYNEEEERKRREEELRQIEEYKKQQEALGGEVSHKQEVTTYADGSQTVKTQREVPAGGQINPVAPQSPQQAQFNASAYGQAAQTGRRYAADINNPSGLGWNGKNWTAFETPEAGVEATKNQIGRYLNSQGPMQGRIPTVDNVVSMWVSGGKVPASQIQNGGYAQAVRGELAKAGVALGPNGEIPNTPQAQMAVTRAMVSRETLPQHQGRFAPALGLAPGETAGVPNQMPQYAGPSQGAEGQTVSAVPPAKPAAMVETPVGTAEPATAEQAPRMAPNSYDEFGTPVYSPQQAELDAKLKTYESIQNDPKALMNFEGPDWMKANARMRAADLLSNQRDEQKAMESIQKADPKDLARTMMREPTDRWEIIKKSAMFRLLGAKGLADAELAKISTPVEKYVQGADGKPYLMKQNAAGEFTEGYNAETGAKLTENELIKVGAGVGQGKWTTSAEFFQDKDGNAYQAQHNERGQTRFVNVQTGAPYAGEGKLERLRDVSRLGQMAQAQQYRRENDMSQFARNIASMDYKGKLAAVAEARQAAINRGEADFTDQELAALGVTRPSLNLFTQTGQVAGAPAAAPAAVPGAQPAGARPVAPTPTAPAAAAPAPAVQPVAPGQVPTAPGVPAGGRMSVEEMKRREAAEKLAREAASQVSVDQQKRFNEYVEKDVQPKADAGKLISRVRKEQINGPDGILNNPEIAGMLQGGQGSEVGNILRDLITGNFKDQADLSSRVAQLNLTQRQKEVLYTQIGLNNQILPQTLKANAGPGAISEAEHKINREANVEITRQPLYSGLTLMTRDQFQKDLAVAKNDFRSANPNIRTTDDLNKAWSAQERSANEAYDRIYAARAAYIAKHNPNNTNPGAVVDAFKYYPVPSWNGSSWDYGTEYAKKAARPPLGSFNR